MVTTLAVYRREAYAEVPHRRMTCVKFQTLEVQLKSVSELVSVVVL